MRERASKEVRTGRPVGAPVCAGGEKQKKSGARRHRLFDRIPCLEDDRIMLRILEPADANDLRELAHDKWVYRYLPTFLFEQKYEDPIEVIERLYSDCFRAKESLILGIFLKENGMFCGLAEFYGYKEALHKTCVGYRLMERCWGRGIATGTVALMVDYLFGRTDIEIITASTMVENRASARVLEKNGFIMTAAGVPEDWGYPESTPADKWFR